VPCFCANGLPNLGHDKLGHQLAGALARAGWLDLDAAGLAALTDDELLALPSIGPLAVARFRTAYGSPPPAVDGVPPSSRRAARTPRRGSAPRSDGRCGCPVDLLELGHDQLGHRTSHLLARAGLLSQDAVTVARMTDYELLQLRGLGSTGLARIRERLPARRVVDLRAACSG
jgi:hypothetical protein